MENVHADNERWSFWIHEGQRCFLQFAYPAITDVCPRVFRLFCWEHCWLKVASKWCFPAGWEPIVFSELRRHGYRVQITRRTVRELPTPCEQRNDGEQSAFDSALTNWISTRERGMIRCGEVDPIELALRMQATWPSIRICVVVESTANVRDGQNRLADHANPHLPEIVILTPACLNERLKPASDVDVTLVANAYSIIREFGMESIQSRLDSSRLFGTFPFDYKPTGDDNWNATQLFGFDEFLLPAIGYREREVHVLVELLPELRLSQELDGRDLERRGICKNRTRNRIIGKIANAIRNGCPDVLSSDLRPQLPDQMHKGAKVAVYVGSVEHALELSRTELTRWPLCTGNAALLADDTGLDASSEAFAIVTPKGMKEFDALPWDYLVRADGGDALPSIHWRQLIQRTREQRTPLQIIDFDDEFHAALLDRADLRRGACVDRGWYYAYCSQAQLRIRDMSSLLLCELPKQAPTG